MSNNPWEESLALNISRVLTPVQPSDLFRDRLRSGLQLASQQHAAQRALRSTRPPGFSQWWLGVAALGVTLATGSVIAWALRGRGLNAPPHGRTPVLSNKLGS